VQSIAIKIHHDKKTLGQGQPIKAAIKAKSTTACAPKNRKRIFAEMNALWGKNTP
jgi:hypothetical protein